MLEIVRRFAQIALILALMASAAAQQCVPTPITPNFPVPKVEEGESAVQSETFLTGQLVISPQNEPHFVDSARRIRRITSDGRMVTVFTPPAAVAQIAFSPAGALHFVIGGQVFVITDGAAQLVAKRQLKAFGWMEGKQDVESVFSRNDRVVSNDHFSVMYNGLLIGQLGTVSNQG